MLIEGSNRAQRWLNINQTENLNRFLRVDTSLTILLMQKLSKNIKKGETEHEEKQIELQSADLQKHLKFKIYSAKKQSTTNIKTTYIIHTPFPILIRQYPYTYWALSADYKRTLEIQNPVCLKKEEAKHD